MLKKYKRRSEIIKALAHPTRLFIMDFLSGGERCVCEIVEQVDFDISTISKHLSVMKNAGLVEDEKRGLNVFYKMTCPCILNLFTCLESISNKD
ncbi:MAG: transcriptional regulator [Candidatus Melainabacteria bacterium GWF2_32_7]|nr:MAG: transcriptional regulator [Candidatus Melainabacteria bacterium GWF2_32_7]